MGSCEDSLKAQLTALGEEWTPSWEAVAHHAPYYVSAYIKLRAVPSSQHHLSLKMQELVLLALDANPTHLFYEGMKLHISQALKAGATNDDILEVLQLSSVLGIHSTILGVPTLVEVLGEAGMVTSQQQDVFDGKNLGEYREMLKANFEKSRGYWSSNWNSTLALGKGSPLLHLALPLTHEWNKSWVQKTNSLIILGPEWFGAYTEYSSVPFQPDLSRLSAKEKELIYIAIDVSTTHMYEPGLKVHVRNAVRYGATAEEIMEVYELAGLMGAQTVLLGVQALDAILGRMPLG